MNLDQAFTFGQDCYNQDLIKQSKHPKISKKSPFYQIVKPASSQQSQRSKIPQLASTLYKNNKENINCQEFLTGQQKHKRNPTDLNLIRFDTSPNSQCEISNNSRAANNPAKCYRRLSFNTPNQTIRTSLPPVGNGDRFKKIALSMKELIGKQKYYYEVGDYEQLEFIFEQLEQLCFQL